MREITHKMRVEKGCEYCTDKRRKRGKKEKGSPSFCCPYNECKYHEMDDCETYDEYCQKETPIPADVGEILSHYSQGDTSIRKGRYIPKSSKRK